MVLEINYSGDICKNNLALKDLINGRYGPVQIKFCARMVPNSQVLIKAHMVLLYMGVNSLTSWCGQS